MDTHPICNPSVVNHHAAAFDGGRHDSGTSNSITWPGVASSGTLSCTFRPSCASQISLRPGTWPSGMVHSIVTIPGAGMALGRRREVE